jgi:hypothetical protein
VCAGLRNARQKGKRLGRAEERLHERQPRNFPKLLAVITSFHPASYMLYLIDRNSRREQCYLYHLGGKKWLLLTKVKPD